MISTGKTNFLLLILLILLPLFSCTEGSTTDSNNPSTTPTTTSLSINYGIGGDFYMALTNTNVLLEQRTDFGSRSNFFVSPSLPNGLFLDITNGSISGTPTTASLPIEYTITATADGKNYTNIISLGVTPSVVWVINTNLAKPYELTAYVVGDGDKQISDWTWISSDESLATVNDGVVSFVSTLMGGTVVISATKDSNTGTITLNVPVASINYGIGGDSYMALTNTNVLLEQKTDFGSQSNFSVSPSLPSGLSLDITNGNISGTSTMVSLPTQYTITANANGKNYIKTISLGVAPSVVWITNTNSAKPYELTVYVVGDGDKQISDWTWISSDESLATVSNGVVNVKGSFRGGTVMISASKGSKIGTITFNVPVVSLNYGVSGDFYIAFTNTDVLLEQKTDFSSQANFSVSPRLPSGLSLDITNGNISGKTPITASLPTLYTVTVTVGIKSYIKTISLGVAPSVVWITNTNSAKPYELTAYVVGDGDKQISNWTWISSDESLATVNNGMVDIKTSPREGDVVISASKGSKAGTITFNVPATSINYGVSGDFYIALTNTNILLEQKTDFGSQANFSVSPSLPSGLSLDITDGNISGTPTTVSLPTPYTVTAIKDGKTYTKTISLGIAPSVAWVTPISSNLLKAYVVGDGDKQINDWIWGSSDENLLTVVNGLVNLNPTATGGNSAIIYATKDISVGSAQGSYSNGISITLGDLSGGKTIAVERSIHLIINSGTKILIDNQFKNKGLTSVVIPDSVTNIGRWAFYNNQLSSVVIPNSVKSIGSWAFQDNQLTTITIPNSVTYIATSAFANNQLSGVVIPNSVTYIDDYAFYNNQLSSVVIPNSVTYIGEYTFSDNQLVNMVIPNRVVYISARAFQNNQLTNVVIPDSVRYIGNSTFRFNRLTSVVFADSVTNIGSLAFSDNQLTSVVIPDSVTTIGSSAFTSNPNLREVNLKQSLYTKITNTSSVNAVFGSQVVSYIKRP